MEPKPLVWDHIRKLLYLGQGNKIEKTIYLRLQDVPLKDSVSAIERNCRLKLT